MNITSQANCAPRRSLAPAWLGGALVVCLALAAPSAFASGGGEGAETGGADAGATSPKTPKKGGADLTTCARGKMWDTKRHKCAPQRSGALSDPAITEYAYALAKAGRYEEALGTLDLLKNPNTPRALNYRGYATRKLGRTQEGIGYYLKSVALDPNYVQVREYLGEAYVLQGKIDLAKERLATIQKICGSPECEEYEDLAEALTQAHAL